MIDPYNLVLEFHSLFGLPVLGSPQFPESARRELRIKLIKEELEEFLVAEGANDLIEVADALADLVYVIYGAALEYGIDLRKVLKEVHRSNMSKVFPDGSVRYREDGKVLKPDSYSPADLKSVLFPIDTEP